MTMFINMLERLVTAALLFWWSVFWGAADHGLRERNVQQHQFTLNAANGTATLIVDNLFGSIDVEAHEGTDVSVEITESIRAKSDRSLERAKEEVRLDISEEAGLLRFYVDGPFRIEQNGRYWRSDPGYEVQYDFKLRIPKRTDLDLRTVSEGHIAISGTAGNFKVQNVNGFIEMRQIAGSGTAHTVNGQVLVKFDTIPASDCEFKTINGNIDLRFPTVPRGDFGLKTMNGRLLTDFDFSYLPPNPATRSRRNGLFQFQTDGKTRVRMGGGGPVYHLETLNGDILIRQND